MGLGLFELWNLMYSRFSIGSHMLVFFIDANLNGISSRVFGLRLSSVINGFGWFWMGSLQKSTHSMFQFLKAPYLVLHFSYYTLMTFLMNTSIYVLFSTVSVIKHLIWQQLDQQDTLDWNRKRLVDFNAPKTQLVLFDWSNNSGVIDVRSHATSCYLDVLDKLQKRICRTFGPSFAPTLKSLARRRNVVSLSLFFFKKKKNWDSLHARLKSHYEARSYKKKKHKKITAYRKFV